MTSMLDNSRPDFDKAQNEATKLLLKQNFDSLSIDVRQFEFDRPIRIDSVQNYASMVMRPLSDFVCDKFSGCCVIRYSRCNLILYDESEKDERRKHWGITHEVGHVYLDHDRDTKKEEIEAHFFAAQLIAPEIVLGEMAKFRGGLYRADIQRFFNLSYAAANKRWNTLQSRKDWCRYADIDRMLLKKFKSILDKELAEYPRCLDWDSVIG